MPPTNSDPLFPTAPQDFLCPRCGSEVACYYAESDQIRCDGCGAWFRGKAGGPGLDPDEVRQVGKFRILKKLGSGTYGTVWHAFDTELKRPVALKIPRSGLLTSAKLLERCQREARAAAQLRHPGLVLLYEVVCLNGDPVLVSEFIDGVSLGGLMVTRPLDFHQTAGVIAAVAEALDYAHSVGLVHRDIKPGNIMVETASEARAEDPRSPAAPASGMRPPGGIVPGVGRPVIVDFGLALREDAEIVLTIEGDIVGTPAYMSPEQAAGLGHVVDGRADVYSLGVVLYEQLTGTVPFRGSNVAIIHQVLHREPVPPRMVEPNVPLDLEIICLKAMAKDRAARFPRARALAEELRRFLDGKPILTRPAGRAERLWRWCWRNPQTAGLMALATFFLLGGALGAFLFGLQAFRESQRVAEYANKLRKEKEESDLRRYAAEIYQARIAVEAGQIALARKLLDAQVPRDPDAFNPCDWEHAYLQGLCRSELRFFGGQCGPLRCLAISPDGQILATGGDDHDVKLWDVATGNLLRTLRGHAWAVWGLAFSPDGRRLASAGLGNLKQGAKSPGEVKVWDVGVGKEQFTLHCPPFCVWAVAFSPDGHSLAAACASYGNEGEQLGGEVKTWDASTGKETRAYRSLKGAIYGVSYSPDGRAIAAVDSTGEAVVWDLTQGTEVFRRLGQRGCAYHLAFSPDGRRLAVAYQDHTLKMYEADTGRELFTMTGHTDDVRAVAFSPDGSRLASVGRHDHVVRVWDAALGSEIMALRGHTDAVYGLAFHPDGWRLASTGEDGTVKLWDSRIPPNPFPTLGHLGDITRIAVSPAGGLLASVSKDRTVRVWDLNLGQLVSCLHGHALTVEALAFHPGGQRLATASCDGTVKIWDTLSGKELLSLGDHEAPVRSLAFSPDGHRLVSGGVDDIVRVWNADTGRLLFSRLGHLGSYVKAIAFSPDGEWFATASGGSALASTGTFSGKPMPGELRIWDTGTGKMVRQFGRRADPYMSLTISPDGRQLVTCGIDHAIRIWDSQTGEEVRVLNGHTAAVQEVAFSPNGRRLASASLDRTVKIWDPNTGHELLTLGEGLAYFRCVSFSPDGRRLVAGGKDLTSRWPWSALWIWDAFPGTPEATEQREATRWVSYLLSGSPPLEKMRAHILADPAVSEEVRRRALTLVTPFYETALLGEAEALVNSRSDRIPFRSELIDHLQQDLRISPRLRQRALDVAARYVEKPDQLIHLSRATVARPAGDPESYRQALRQATAACRLAPPVASYLSTLGIAQYRTAKFDDAISTLIGAARLYEAAGEPVPPEVFAFTAMAYHRLGQSDSTRKWLKCLREALKKPEWIHQEEALRFSKEAEALVENGPPGKALGKRD